jgi:hypothetical protein
MSPGFETFAAQVALRAGLRRPASSHGLILFQCGLVTTLGGRLTGQRWKVVCRGPAHGGSETKPFTPHRLAVEREAACSVIHSRAGDELELFFETGFRDGVANQR